MSNTSNMMNTTGTSSLILSFLLKTNFVKLKLTTNMNQDYLEG